MQHALEVVVVDDELEITDFLREYIQMIIRETRIHTFNDAYAAREFVTHNPVDLLITDYRMPGLDGLQLMDSAPSTARKVLISGYVFDIVEEKSRNVNAAFFEKPVPLRALAKIISQCRETLV